MTRNKIKLIAPDKNGIFSYHGACKLTIDSKFSKTLKVEPKNKNFPDISALFRWKFIQKMNLLFIFGEIKIQDFVLIFANDEICKKVHDAIYKNREEDSVEKEELHQRFLLPIFLFVSRNSIISKRIFLDWIEKHEENEKNKLLKLLKEQENNNHQIMDVKNVKQELNTVNARKRRFSEMKNEEENYSSSNSNFKCEYAEVHPQMNKVVAPFVGILDESSFKIVNVKQSTGFYRKLLIFTSSEKTHCYEYKYFSKKQIFYHKCYHHANFAKAILKLDENGNECIKYENKKHVCSPIQYNPENYLELKIVRKPNYEILENCSTQSKRMLIIFDPNDRNQCYEYYWSLNNKNFRCRGCHLKKKNITAEIVHENTETEYIRLLNDDHICEIRKYNPEKFNKINKYVLSPNFEIQTKIKDGKERKTVIIFNQSNRNLCYIYFFDIYKNAYFCSGCKKNNKNVSAKLYQNQNGEEYVILSNAKHVCSLQPYAPQQNEIILRPPQIKFIESNNDKYKPKLFIFDSKDNQLCYNFTQCSGENSKRFFCLGCINSVKTNKTKINDCEMKGAVSVYLLKNSNDNDESYVKMRDNQKHLCKPQKYEPERYEIKILQPKEDYLIFQKSEKRKDYPGLAIYHPDNKNLCYRYYYTKEKKQFQCFACQTNKTTLTAKIQQDSNENECIIINQKKHVCNPFKISSVIKPGTVILEKSGLTFEESKKKEIDESRIIRLPNFELRRNKLGIPERKLIVFKSDNKNFCYEYGHHGGKVFKCKKCKICANLSINFETGEKYIILSKNEHTCEPVKFEPDMKIIAAPDFMVFNKDDESKVKKLIIFTSLNKDLCYEYSFVQKYKYFQCVGCYSLKKTVSAKLLLENSNGKEYIQLSKNDHFCEPKKFILEEFQPKIIAESGFKLYCNQYGKPNSKLVLFDSEKDGFCFEYMLTRNNIFICNQCRTKKKRVTARLCQKENGKKYLELSVEEHICKSAKCDPENYKENEKKTVFDNFVVQHNTNGDPNSRLTVFDENDKNLGYQYSFHKSRNAFFCCGCFKTQKSTSAKLKVDEDGKQYIEFGKTEHSCSIHNFKQKNLIFNDFTFEENGNALITNYSKKKCYKFKYDSDLDVFCCVKCKEKKEKIITATVCNGNDGKEILLLNDAHFCSSLSK